jgi:hypothetical protein
MATKRTELAGLTKRDVDAVFVDDDAPSNEPKSTLGKIALDEPVFILRANDRVAPGVVRDWAHRARGAGCINLAKIQEAMDQAGRMEEWQAKHPNLMKVPD